MFLSRVNSDLPDHSSDVDSIQLRFGRCLRRLPPITCKISELRMSTSTNILRLDLFEVNW